MVYLSLNWIKQAEAIQPPQNSVLFSARTLAGLFADYPKLEVVGIKTGEVFGPIENEVNLLVTGDFPLYPDTFPSTDGANPVRQHVVGDSAQGTLRYVYQFIGPKTGLPFRAGLTVHGDYGTWSSLPHKFEAEAILSPRPLGFREKFAYVTWPRGGWGVQTRVGHLNGVMVNELVTIGDRDIFDIPLGSHPVSGGPGIRMSYFWFYAADELSMVEKFED